MDGFTQKYVSAKFGIIDFTPIEVEEEADTLVLPKLNDLDINQRTLVPKPPKKNFQKMLDNDRKVLRFSATMKSSRPQDKDRRFVVSFHLADDTLAIYEQPQRNSGFVGGKYLERRQVVKSDGRPYETRDFFVGAVIEVR